MEMNRDRLLFVDGDGQHKLELPVEWSGVAKTEDHPMDVEIQVGDMSAWTSPAGEPIPPATRERILDEIAASYSKGPFADIVDDDGALLRGVSRYRFVLRMHPDPSVYSEPRRRLNIPMVNTEPSARPQLVLDISNIREWTYPKEPISQEKLEEIVARALKQSPQIGVRR
jgi:hypothetical protein